MTAAANTYENMYLYDCLLYLDVHLVLKFHSDLLSFVFFYSVEFHKQTSPVLAYYKDKVATINADSELETITQNIRAALDK